MAAELVLSQINERKLAPHGRKFTAARWLARAGPATQAARRRSRIPRCCIWPRACCRYAWVGAGPASARDDRAVAELARSARTPV
jgi:hypothetical protein